ncbi:disintegrin and metalloproteinase domain-containing protein 8 isoform X4 [Rattus norvegicus]|uniref:disintegrin and metalloproteinase domain-containing protein 8 isoform X4 n=1 Tax=Rattus norvegicus TaxID=10116 RepID=UPI0019178606|nr:disintegrin and metalloproteinase domain-containing protein 8 isoform X5 [Rattus norvegicus]
MLGLWLLSILWTPAVAPGPPLPHVKQYEVVWPRRLAASRSRRSLPSQWGLYPESLSYALGTSEQVFTLHLRKNRDLLGSSYTETYSAANGSEVKEQLHEQDHCLYQGHVEGYEGSAASISTCAGLSGFFRVGSTVHLIEPLDADEEGQHAVYQAKHLEQKAGTCGVSETSLDKLGPRTLEIYRAQPGNWLKPREIRYVELYVVADSQEFQKLGTREAVRQRVLEVVNHVDKLYRELSFRVVLVGLEIWNKDKFYISRYANVTLENFLSWREQNLLGRHPHDNVQLITGVDFIGTTVGLAKVSALCSRHSGAVNQDHTRSAIGVASTMAHELGHNLGMNHDENIPGCYCPIPREGGGCIMTESIGSKFPKTFSRCSQVDLESFVTNHQTGCLTNVPDVNRFVGGPVCGNLFVERGEQCDCGTPQDCQNPCCNATTCQLAKGAECAHGACCHECKVKPAGELCRPMKDKCDLEEFCDGQKPTCPEDAFQQNGTPCPGGYCFDGSCPTLAQQCQALWGPGARAASDSCFAFSIPQGCYGSMYPSRINRCGVLFCEGGQKPLERSSCTFSSHHGLCQALQTDSNTNTYEFVLQGTKCEEGKVCMDGNCQDLRVYRSENCSAKCNNHGVCNHKRECHCHAGWAPPYCAQLLADVPVVTESAAVHSTTASGNWRGLNSGTVGLGLATTTSSNPLLESQKSWSSESLPVSVVVVLVILVAAVVIGAGIVIYRKAPKQIQRRSVAPKPTSGLSNPLFYTGDSSLPAKSRPPDPPEMVSTNQPPRPIVKPKRPPPAPPGAMSSPPLPVPVYAPKAPNQVKPTFAPPTPPVKPGTGGTVPGVTQGAGGSKVALKVPIQKR